MVVLISYKVMAPVSMVGQCRIQVWTPTVPSTTWKRPRLNEVEYPLVNVYSLLLKMAIYSGFSHKKIVIFHSYVKLPEGTTFGSKTQSL